MNAIALLAAAWLAQAQAPQPELEPPPPPPAPAPPPAARRYGDAGTSDLSLGLGYAQGEFLAAAGYRRFVLPGLAPGAEARVETGGGTTLGFLLASARLVPIRTSSFALALTARGGRVLVSGHDDGWGVGGDVGLIIGAGSGVAFEVGYEALRLEPASFCADFTSCWIQGPVVGLRILF
jgi:hypothetical protein